MVVLQNNLTTRSRLCVFFCIFVVIKFGKYYRLFLYEDIHYNGNL